MTKEHYSRRRESKFKIEEEDESEEEIATPMDEPDTADFENDDAKASLVTDLYLSMRQLIILLGWNYHRGRRK